MSKEAQLHFSQAREQLFKVHDSCFAVKEIMDRQGTRTLSKHTSTIDRS